MKGIGIRLIRKTEHIRGIGYVNLINNMIKKIMKNQRKRTRKKIKEKIRTSLSQINNINKKTNNLTINRQKQMENRIKIRIRRRKSPQRRSKISLRRNRNLLNCQRKKRCLKPGNRSISS